MALAAAAVATLPILSGIAAGREDNGDHDIEVIVNLNSACCSTNTKQANSNVRITYRAPEGANAPDAPGGSFTADQKSCIASCFKNCFSCCCKAPEGPRPLTKEEENAIANRLFIQGMIAQYGYVPTNAAIVEFSQKRGRRRHNFSDKSPLRVKHTVQLREKARELKKIFDPFYHELLRCASSHSGEEPSQSFRQHANLTNSTIVDEEMKEENPPTHKRYKLSLPGNLQQSLSIHAPAPKDCFALIQAIKSGAALVQEEAQIES